MLYFKWTFLRPSALGQVFLGFLADIISLHLLLVTRLTEMSGSPAEPLGNRAAESAFKLNEICAMDVTVLDSCSYTDRRALSAH